MKELTKNAIKVLEARYLKRDEEGNLIETPDEMFRRVAKAVAQAENTYTHLDSSDRLKIWGNFRKYEVIFYNMMANLDFLPNSPTLMNAGTEEGQLSACFVLPVNDSMQDIFESVKHAALIQKSGGGVGYSFSNLRPAGDRVKTTQGVSSGPVSFMRVFNEATETVKQGGKRRGANMGVLRVDHPDILEFINCKNQEGQFVNFNISVGITNKFMDALTHEEDFELINPRTGAIVKKIPATEIWENIIKNAWEKGDPGLLFLDRINQDNPIPKAKIESTNPCGEACLLPYEACNLGSINISNFVINKKIDYKRLKEVIGNAVRFLDNVIDVNQYVELIPEIKNKTKRNRKIGLGIMGFADLLIDLRIPYNSIKALGLISKLMSFFYRETKKASVKLAKERDSYYGCDEKYPVRNASLLSIAPTGTLSIIAGCSPGIEPLFGICFEKNVLDDTKLFEINSWFIKIAEEEGFYSEQLIEKIRKTGTVQDLPIPDNFKELFKIAQEIEPEQHLRVQAAFQQFVDMSVSKTINLPFNASKEDVEKIYWQAYALNCKGITVFRDGCRSQQVIDLGDSNRQEELNIINIPTVYANQEVCVECGQGVFIVGSCSTCQYCGYSKCG